MWYWWTNVKRADIPPKLRVEFEQLGEAVVAHIVGRPLTHGPGNIGVPFWVGQEADRQHALRWLAEQHSRTERRQDIGEAVEIAILVLVAIEAIPILVDVIHRNCK